MVKFTIIRVLLQKEEQEGKIEDIMKGKRGKGYMT